MNNFKFELGAEVRLALSDEKGVVIGRMEHTGTSNQFAVRYVTADGRQVEGWFDEDALMN